MNIPLGIAVEILRKKIVAESPTREGNGIDNYIIRHS